jgi:hypothetical protein
MSSEIAEGESTLAETAEQLAELKTFVNTPPSSTKNKEKVETQEASSGSEVQIESGETTAPKPKRSHKPGDRNPKRDKVGRKSNAS